MKTATTLEFRKAVRKYADKKNLTIGESWTNKTTASDYSDHRTVGFYMANATAKVAAKIEKKLNKKGLAAQTRISDSESKRPPGCYYGGAGTYIRGTCVLA